MCFVWDTDLLRWNFQQLFSIQKTLLPFFSFYIIYVSHEEIISFVIEFNKFYGWWVCWFREMRFFFHFSDFCQKSRCTIFVDKGISTWTKFVQSFWYNSIMLWACVSEDTINKMNLWVRCKKSNPKFLDSNRKKAQTHYSRY